MNALSYCILHSKILTSIMISGCMVLAGCSEFFIKRSVFEESSKCPIPATESGMLGPGCLFVGIGHFDDSSNTDHLMKNSEHPFLQTILDLTLECCQSSDSWMLVSYYLILR